MVGDTKILSIEDQILDTFNIGEERSLTDIKNNLARRNGASPNNLAFTLDNLVRSGLLKQSGDAIDAYRLTHSGERILRRLQRVV